METALPVITLISVAVAIYFWAIARRVERREQERSDARVAALSEAAGRPASTRDGWAQVDGEWHWGQEVEPKRHVVAHRSLEDSFPAERIATSKPATADREQVPTSSDHFFGTVERETPSGNRLPLVAAAALIVVLGGALIFLNTPSGDENGPTVARVAHQEPLELVSLAHNRDAKVLTITGMVRNPATGPKLEGLTAVVTLLDTAGTLVSTKDVPLDYRALGPGEEAPFKISIPDPGVIARYRVSFRAGTDVVPHVDRRSNTKLASALE